MSVHFPGGVPYQKGQCIVSLKKCGLCRISKPAAVVRLITDGKTVDKQFIARISGRKRGIFKQIYDSCILSVAVKPAVASLSQYFQVLRESSAIGYEHGGDNGDACVSRICESGVYDICH